MDDSGNLIYVLESEYREECRVRKDSDKKIREAIKTLERELRDESVSRKTAERKIVQLYDTIDALCSRMTFLEKKLEDYLDHCPHCKHTRNNNNNNNNNNNPDADPSSLSSVDSSKSISTDLSPSISSSSSSVSPPTTPTFLPMQSISSLTPISPPSPLRVSVSHPRIQDPFGPHSPIINNTRHRFSAGLVPLQTPSSPSSSSSSPIPSSPLASTFASSPLSPPSNPTPPSPSSFGPLSPPPSSPFNPNINSPSSANVPSLSLSPSSTLPPSSPISSINSPRNFPHGGSSIMRAYSASNLSTHLHDKGDSPSGKTKQNGKEKDKKDKKEKDKDKEEEEVVTKETSRKTRIFSRKAIVSMLSPPTSPLQEPSPKSSRKASPSRKDRDDSEKDKDKDNRMEKSKSFQLVRSSSVLRLKSIQSFPLKSSLKIEPSHPMSVFNNMGVSDETCVKVIKDITSFLKNYVHMPPSDLFQQKAWSEQAILLKEAIQAGTVPDFSFKYQHDPHSVAQFLYEILASSDKGILSKVGQGLVDSVEIDLENYPGLKFYRLSLLHSLVFLLEEDPHFALFYTLDLLRSFVKIRPEAYNFFGQKFGPVCLKDFPERSPNAFATLLVNFSAILEVREDINFVVKDGRQTVHAASLERLFEKLLDPYYRDSLFVDTFFLTFDYFINAEEMLKKFTAYYWLAATGFPQNWKTQLSIRVLVVIKMWIMQHEEMFQKDENFLTLLRSFVDSVTTPYQSELAFFRYFASLAYKSENDQDGEEDGDHADNANGNVLSELSNDSELYVSKNSSGSFTDNPISTSDERSSSALTMYDLDDEFSKSDTPTTLSPIELKSDTPPGFSPVAESEFAKADNPIIRSASESNAPQQQQQQQQQPTSQLKGGSPLNRSSSSNNIYVTKDGKIGTVTRVFNKSNKSPSSSNLFAAYTNPRATSPTPGESSPDDSDNNRHRGATLSVLVSPPSPTPIGNEKDKEKDSKKSGLLIAHRKSRSRGNSDDANLLKLMASSDIPKLLSQGQFNPVCSIDPAIVAMHMAVIDQSFLRMIPYTEWLHKSFVSQDLSPNFHNMVAKFNDWGRWACTEILRREKLADRVNVVTYFVDIIKHSVAINNFNAAAALIGGLSHSSVSRLRPTWEKVPAKVMQDFTKMTTLFEMLKNYKNYREAVKTCKPPVIPYLALIPKDLIAIEEGNATTLENGLINFHKLRLLAKLVKYVAQIQQPLYVHPNNTHEPALNEYLRNKLGGKEGLLAEREMMNLSLILQPFASTSKGV